MLTLDSTLIDGVIASLIAAMLLAFAQRLASLGSRLFESGQSSDWAQADMLVFVVPQLDFKKN